jgi:hypothetical protein
LKAARKAWRRWRTQTLLAGIALIILFFLYHLRPYPRIQGVNLLQSRRVDFTHASTLASLKELKAIGGNSVAVIPFLQQEQPNSIELRMAKAVTQTQLLGAIRSAHKLGLRVIVKPQILLPGSWAGAIDHPDDTAWQAWFEAYQEWLLHYARLAEAEGAAILVLGTELKNAGQRPEWVNLIGAVRQVYHGELSYSAHNLDGLKKFAHWHLLDSAAVTLYPTLGKTGQRADMKAIIQAQTANLRDFQKRLRRPIWVAEIGIASRQGAFAKPWAWNLPADQVSQPDQHLQAQVLDLWLKALDGAWNRGVLIWAWYNDPRAGGSADTDFTPQNKLAATVLSCHWRWFCFDRERLKNL